jgi:DNA-binding MarR family transcriptional regulator
MTKLDLLRELDRIEQPDAYEMASTLGVTYPAAAMALLRLVRQSLAARYRDAESGLYWYALTEKGEARLDYVDNAQDFEH